MRRLAILLVAVGWLGWARPAASQTYIQSTYQSGTNSPFSSITVTSGSMLIVLLSCRGATCPATSVSDNNGGTWTGQLLTGGANCTTITSSNGPQIAFASYNHPAGATIVTVAAQSTNYEGFLAEYSGIASASAFDQYTCQQQVNQSTQTSGNTGTTSQASELVISLNSDSANPSSAGTGFTRRNTGIGNLNDAFEDKNVSSTGVQAATWGASGSSTAGVSVLTFKATLTPPTITSANTITFTATVGNTFTVAATGSATITFSETGSLPSAVTLSSAGVLSGVPGGATLGIYPIVITATNGQAPDATQNFTLIITNAAFTGQIISAPMLPQVTPGVVYPSESGYTITSVASGANLQTAISAAACGTVLSLAHNGNWSTSSTYTLPANSCACHTDSTKWIIIRSDSYVGGSTRGARLDPSNEYTSLAHISSTATPYAVSSLAAGDSCWWIGPGLDITDTTDGANAVITTDDGTQTVANYSHDIVACDHSYIHGQPTLGLSRPIMLNGNWLAVVDCYLADGHKTGADTQAISIFDGTGGILVQNSFLEGASENFLYGGTSIQPGVNTADITFKNNHFFKPLAWRKEDPTYIGIHWSVKNLFEFKGAQRVLVTGNIWENVWVDGQTGQAINIKSSTNPQQNPTDFTFYYNILRHAAGALVIAADTTPENQPDHRLSFSNNLYWDIDGCKWGFAGCGSTNIQLGGSGSPAGPWDVFDVTLNHETYSANVSSIGRGAYFTTGPNYGMVFTNLIIPRGTYGIRGDLTGGSSGDTRFPAPQTPGGNMNNMCLYGPTDGFTYANSIFNGIQLVTSGQSGVFTNQAGGNFTVAVSSACHNAATDGTDIGANISAVNAATSGVTQTYAALQTVTNISPTTFTHLGNTTLTVTGTNFISGEAQVIVGGAGPTAAINTITCSVNTCTVVMTGTITLAVNDNVTIMGTSPDTNSTGTYVVASVTDNQHFTYTDTGVGTQSEMGGTANRNSAGALCTSPSVTSTSITCQTPAGNVGPVSVFVSQFGIPVQSTVFGNYN